MAKAKLNAHKLTGSRDSSGKWVGELTTSDYVHLHNHTQYSLLDGLTRIPDLVDHVNSLGMTAVAKTDHGTLSGTIEFYKESVDKGIKPIIGIETYVAARSHKDKDPQKDKNRYHLILLAMNNNGYQNLMELSSIANLDGFYYFPRVDHGLLEKYNQGLIALSGCMGGEIGDALKQGQYDQALLTAKWYKKVFGNRYYLEIQDSGHPDAPSHSVEQGQINEQILRLGKELDIPVVVTCDAHYLKHEDQEAHEILLCVGTGAFLSDEKRMSLKDFQLHVTDPREIIDRWGKEHPEVVYNSRIIADKCQVDIELGKILIPKFPVPRGETERSYLEKLVYRGLAWRYGGMKLSEIGTLSLPEAKKVIPNQMLDRAEYELGVIESMGFNGYFLIVQDFINWGKDIGIIFGPGRGSAAGSIVSYALRITELDPLAYDLMFERFLNPSRISMPDIDIDIQDSRRDEVIQYCVQKYGSDRVANIVTYGRMFARNAVRDVARVLQVPYAEADRLAKMIPQPIQGRHIPLNDSLVQDPDLRREYEINPDSKRVLDEAVILEGTVRSHGVHAAGVVIAPDKIVKYTPLEMAQKGVVTTQYPMGPIEELGLLKMDFLGLSNLTIVNNALRIVRKVYKKDIDLASIPMDDAKTFELLQNADTTGVFQLESAGMKRYLKELKPTLFEDIIAMVALYRPGPMAEIPQFIQGKNDSKSIKFMHKSLEPILKDTYGVMVFQEQIINLLQLIAGYTPGEADLVRKAIGKKNRNIMAAEEPKFVAGCLKQGLTQHEAEKLWALIQPFADYSFNKAHAACYALIAYWTAYLKANYPQAYMAALMTSAFDDNDRLAIEITECKRMNIDVLAPDVNESFVEFGIVPGTNQIRFGMNAIKNVGTGAVEEILRARESVGKFESLEQFLELVDCRIANRKVMESLIKTGAFDSFGERSVLLYNIDSLLAYANRAQKQANSGQIDLFGEAIEGVVTRPKLALETPTAPPDRHEQLLWERELLGIYLSRHPLETYEAFLDEQTIPLSQLQPEHNGKGVVVGGYITDVREITTRKGQKMAFVQIEDRYSELEVILFPGSYQQTAGIWERDKVVLIQGKVSAKDKDGAQLDQIKVLVDDAREVTIQQAEQYQPNGKKRKPPRVAKTQPAKPLDPKTDAVIRLFVRMPSGDDTATLTSLKQTIDDHQGDTEVVLVLGDDASRQVIKLPGGIDPEGLGVQKLSALIGAENVVLR